MVLLSITTGVAAEGFDVLAVCDGWSLQVRLSVVIRREVFSQFGASVSSHVRSLFTELSLEIC